MSEKRSEIKGDILIRVRWLYVLFVLTGVAIFARVLYIQYGPDGDDLRKKAIKISYDRVDIEANRGDILAVDGRVLAISVPMFEIRMDFAAAGIVDSVFNRNVDSLAYCLSAHFGDRSTAGYRNMLVAARKNRDKNRYALISPRRVDFLELKKINKFPIFRLGPNKGGFITTQINIRTLPHKSLARRTIGSVNAGGSKWGVEGAFDEYLRGTNGNTMMQRVSGSFKIPVPDDGNVEPIDGIDVVTTIDVDVQDVAETALKQQLEYGGAQWGSVVLMEVETGEIRAMSNITRRSNGEFVEDFNYAIGMSLEPGSTFKLASLMALLDDGGMTLDDKIDTENGRAVVGKATVVDSHKEGVLTLREVFEKSSNIGFAKAVHSTYGKEPKRFTDFISKIGIDKPLGMQIAGERTPEIKRPGERWWDGMTLVMMSYGYALRITPMHTLSLYNAVANGGRMMRPLLVKELREYGKTVKKFEPEVISDQICSKPTLDSVRHCLEGVVDEGTARFALKNPYYKVAGKTGTAQIAQGRHGYTDAHGGRHYLATLVGYFPADKPKYSCIVAIKTYYGPGSYKTYYGASLSGPVFRAIADRVYSSNIAWQKPVSDNADPVVGRPIQVKGGNVKEIKSAANKLSVPITGAREVERWGATQIDTTTSGVDVMPVERSLSKVPSVVGMGLKEAVYLLESRGLKVSFRGVGHVVSQSISAGADAERGRLITIVLEV